MVAISDSDLSSYIHRKKLQSQKNVKKAMEMMW